MLKTRIGVNSKQIGLFKNEKQTLGAKFEPVSNQGYIGADLGTVTRVSADFYKAKIMPGIIKAMVSGR